MNKILAIKFTESCPLFSGWVKHFSDVPYGRKVLFDKIGEQLTLSFLRFTNHAGGMGATLSADIPDEWVEDYLEIK